MKPLAKIKPTVYQLSWYGPTMNLWCAKVDEKECIFGTKAAAEEWITQKEPKRLLEGFE